MKIKIHSSMKNIRSMVACYVPMEIAVDLAASTIVEAEPHTSNDYEVKVIDSIYCRWWALKPNQFIYV